MTDYRKLIKFGNNSIIMSLPKSWANHHKLEPGQSVRIEQHADNLIISPQSTGTTRTERHYHFTIADDEATSIKRKIANAYVNNCDLITIKGAIPEKNKELRDLIHQFMALEIIEETATTLQAKCYLNMHDINTNTLIRKIDAIIKSMFKDLDDHLTNPKQFSNIDVPQNLAERDGDINRLCFLIMRSVKHALEHPHEYEKKAQDLLCIWDFAQTVEKIGDQLKRVARLVELLDNKPAKAMHALIKKVASHYDCVMTAYHKKNTAAMHTCALKRQPFVKLFDDYEQEHEQTVAVAKALQKVRALFHRIDELTTLLDETQSI
jgi:phosphate uptake regulator